MLWQIKKWDLHKFISSLRNNYEVIAPVQKDIVRYCILSENDRVTLEQPLYPAKRFFLPLKEPILKFKNKKVVSSSNSIKKRVAFLAHCDTNALFVLDKIMLDSPADPYYREYRDKTLIFQFEPLKKPDNYFADEMDLIDFCDIKIYAAPKCLVLMPQSHFGLELLKAAKLPRFHGKAKDDAVDNPGLQDKRIEEENKGIWVKEARNCLSCSSCTTVCPTCSCFEIIDDIDFEASSGTRRRDWSSCQLLDFTEVAGGHVFRQERTSRLKQRVLHKFKYFKERFGVQMCVGCGRCITACPSDINIHKIVKKLK